MRVTGLVVLFTCDDGKWRSAPLTDAQAVEVMGFVSLVQGGELLLEKMPVETIGHTQLPDIQPGELIPAS